MYRHPYRGSNPYGHTVRPIYEISGDPNNLTSKSSYIRCPHETLWYTGPLHKYDFIRRQFLVAVTYPKIGETIWNCVEDNIIGEGGGGVLQNFFYNVGLIIFVLNKIRVEGLYRAYMDIHIWIIQLGCGHLIGKSSHWIWMKYFVSRINIKRKQGRNGQLRYLQKMSYRGVLGSLFLWLHIGRKDTFWGEELT